MRDINLQLRRAYYDLLNGNVTINSTTVPFYNSFVPKDYPSFYVVIQNIVSTGRESKNDQDREVSIQFVVSTRLDRNSGWECDQIADQILNIAYPYRGFAPEGCLSMDLVSDNPVGDIDPATGKQIIERIITFKHIVTS